MALHIQADEWTKNQSIGTDWVTVWTTNVVDFKSKFYHAVWQINSSNMRVRLIYDNQTALDLNLDELSQDFKLSSPYSPANEFILIEYHNPGRWMLKPPEPFYTNIGSSISIDMKSTQNNKIYILSRGITVWGQP